MTTVLPEHKEGSHNSRSVVECMEKEEGHCVMEARVTAFTSFVMNFIVMRVAPVVTFLVGSSQG